MFTGIVDHCGEIKKITKQEKSFRLSIDTKFKDLQLGESIAIDGACLTVTSYESSLFCVDVSPETIRLTTAGSYAEGVQVNLERSLRLMDRVGGHFVTGHIDGLCRVSEIKPIEEFIEISFDGVTLNNKSLLVKKGSIAINGVSLTLNDVSKDGFKVMLIPHTLSRTNLSQLAVGKKVNIEYDYLAKLVVNQLHGEKHG